MYISPAHRHLVGGQGSSLIRTNDGGASQSFHRRQRADDSVLLGHSPRAQSETGGDDGGQTLGNSGYGQSDGNLEVVHGTLTSGGEKN